MMPTDIYVPASLLESARTTLSQLENREAETGSTEEGEFIAEEGHLTKHTTITETSVKDQTFSELDEELQALGLDRKTLNQPNQGSFLDYARQQQQKQLLLRQILPWIMLAIALGVAMLVTALEWLINKV